MDELDYPFRKYGGRKFLLTVVLILLYTLLLLWSYITKEIWQSMVGIQVGVYFTANVSQKIFVKKDETSMETNSNT